MDKTEEQTMNGNYHFNRFYAQEKINVRLHEAESHRLARQGKERDGFGFMIAGAGQVANWIDRATDQAAQSLQKLGQARVAPLHR
jgi:hypothetical protein